MGFRRFFWIVLPIVLILAALVSSGLIFFWKTEGSIENEILTPVIVSEEDLVENLESEEKLDRSNLKLQILNGRGIAGTAAEAQEYLESLKYKVIETGNAENYDYLKTEVFIKTSKKEFLEILEKDLADGYRISTEIGEVSDSEEYDAVVIIGLQ